MYGQKFALIVPGLLLLASSLFICQPNSDLVFSQSNSSAFNEVGAKNYLEERTSWWIHNMGAIDHGTACVSCHTALPFALAMPQLRARLGEDQFTKSEQALLNSVTKRVENTDVMATFLSGPEQSRGTESVLNALVLTKYATFKKSLSPDVELAFTTLWHRQIKTGPSRGSWSWFSLGNEPWEAPDSQYWGATLAGTAVGMRGLNYTKDPLIKENISLLRSYLLSHEVKTSLFNQASLMLTSEHWKGLISRADELRISNELIAKQNSDGGWSTSSLIAPTWKRSDGTSEPTTSDGYGTGYITYILENSNLNTSLQAVRRGRHWLLQNQNDITGTWYSPSVNKRRDPISDIGKFMTDAATAYAVLALTSKPN